MPPFDERHMSVLGYLSSQGGKAAMASMADLHAAALGPGGSRHRDGMAMARIIARLRLWGLVRKDRKNPDALIPFGRSFVLTLDKEKYQKLLDGK